MRVCVHAFVAVFSRDLRPANHTLGRHSLLRNCTLLNWLGLHYKTLVFPSNQCQNVTPHVVNMCGSRSRHSLVYSPWAPLFRHLLPSRENSFRRILEGKKKPVTIACLQSQKLTQRNTLNKTSFLTLLTLRLCPGVGLAEQGNNNVTEQKWRIHCCWEGFKKKKKITRFI